MAAVDAKRGQDRKGGPLGRASNVHLTVLPVVFSGPPRTLGDVPPHPDSTPATTQTNLSPESVNASCSVTPMKHCYG